jgi:hypothetical protein
MLNFVPKFNGGVDEDLVLPPKNPNLSKSIIINPIRAKPAIHTEITMRASGLLARNIAILHSGNVAGDSVPGKLSVYILN